MQKDRGEIYKKRWIFQIYSGWDWFIFCPYDVSFLHMKSMCEIVLRSLCLVLCPKGSQTQTRFGAPPAQRCLLLFTGLIFCSRLKKFCLYSLKGFPIFTLFCLLGDSLFSPSLYVSKSLSSFQTHFLRRSDRKVDLWGKVNLFVGLHHISCQLLPRKSESISASTTRICCVLLGFAITVAILYTVPLSLSVSFPLHPLVYFWLLGPP